MNDFSASSVSNSDLINSELSEDLLGDLVPDIDPEKLFDEAEYSTLVLGSENTLKKDTSSIHAIEVLISKTTSREEKDEALFLLKDNKAQGVIVNAIEQLKKAEQKIALMASCWETGLDFENYFLTFVDYTTHAEYHLALEAFTVIQEMETEIDAKRLETALTKLQAVKQPNDIVTDTLDLIQMRLNALHNHD